MTKFKRYDSYINSGIEWLGEIPSHWEVKKLKFVAKQILGGGTPNSLHDSYWTNSQSDGYLWVSIEDISTSEVIRETKKYISKLGLQNCSAKIIKPYSILYSIYASLGKVAYSEKFLTTNQAILSIEVQEKHYYKFMFYYLKTLTQVAINLSNSTTQNNISLLILKNLYCALPPKDEQEKIASYLDEKIAKIDTAVSGKEKLIELLKEQKQIIINDALTKGLNKNAKFKNSGVEWLGEIPSHWEIRKVKNIFKLIIDPAPIGNKEKLLSIYTDIGVKPRSELIEKGNKASTIDGYLKVKKGDFIVNKLLAWMGAIGLSEYKGVTSPAYDILRAKIPIIGKFYHELFRLNVFSEEMKKYSRGIMDMRLRLYFDKFGDILIPLPPKDEQEKIVEYIENKISKIDKLVNLEQEYIKSLKEYKESLIDSVVTGKVRIV
ncbi:restriction endonuclease subunit S [Campylobacter concisus]